VCSSDLTDSCCATQLWITWCASIAAWHTDHLVTNEVGRHRYDVLIAVTGSILEAIAAGTIPATVPTIEATPKPIKIFLAASTITKVPSGIKVRRYTRNIPTTPPITLRINDSNKNCNRIKSLFAPIDFRIPIKFVPALTETNIILTIPQPPTVIENPPITHPAQQ